MSYLLCIQCLHWRRGFDIYQQGLCEVGFVVDFQRCVKGTLQCFVIMSVKFSMSLKIFGKDVSPCVLEGKAHKVRIQNEHVSRRNLTQNISKWNLEVTCEVGLEWARVLSKRWFMRYFSLKTIIISNITSSTPYSETETDWRSWWTILILFFSHPLCMLYGCELSEV